MEPTVNCMETHLPSTWHIRASYILLTNRNTAPPPLPPPPDHLFLTSLRSPTSHRLSGGLLESTRLCGVVTLWYGKEGGGGGGGGGREIERERETDR